MKALLNAIYTKFTGTPSLVSAFPGGFHQSVAPEGTAMPYMVSTVSSSVTGYRYGGVRNVETRIRFAAYGVGFDATCTALETFDSVFDEVLLPLASGHTNNMRRMGDPMPTYIGKDQNVVDVWRWIVEYEYVTSY